jgi:hypothetical protein
VPQRPAGQGSSACTSARFHTGTARCGKARSLGYECDRTTAAGSVERICSVRSLLAKRVLELLVRQTDHEIDPDLVLHWIVGGRLAENLL